MTPAALARKIARLAQTKKASDIVIMNLKKISPVTDYFVVCSADSDTQARAIADAVEDGLERAEGRPWHREAGSANWILLDYVDVVLHVFHKQTRSFYNLEKLWGDSVITHIADDAPARRARTVGTKKASRTARPRKPAAS